MPVVNGWSLRSVLPRPSLSTGKMVAKHNDIIAHKILFFEHCIKLRKVLVVAKPVYE